MLTNKKLQIKDIALIGILSATITSGKFALSFVPNVEIVTLLLMVYTIVFGIKVSLLCAFIFSTIEIFIYGFHTWLLGYYLIWPILILISAIMNTKIKTEYGYAVLAGIFGFTFGLFFAVIESLFYGIPYGISYWIRGIPFDIVHGVSNFIIVLFLFKPLINLLQKQKNNFL